jgi:hypothetical protein
MLDIDVFIEKTKKKSRLIGIDPGGKRIGIALSDENKIVATKNAKLIKKLTILITKEVNFPHGFPMFLKFYRIKVLQYESCCKQSRY